MNTDEVMDADEEIEDPIVEVRLVSPMYVGEEYLDEGTELRVPLSMQKSCTAMALKTDEDRPKPRDISSLTSPQPKPEIIKRAPANKTEQEKPVSLQQAGKAPKLTGHGTGKPVEATLAECIEAAKGIDVDTLPADSLTPKGYMKKAVLELLVKKPVSMPVFLDFMKQPLD